jgi:hypothetical protein
MTHAKNQPAYRVAVRAVLFFFVLLGDTSAAEQSSTRASPAKLSGAERWGTTAGRVLGAATMCGVKSERLQSIARRTFALIDQVGKGESDRASADKRMRDGLKIGRDDITEGRSTCQATRSELDKLEQRLAQRR